MGSAIAVEYEIETGLESQDTWVCWRLRSNKRTLLLGMDGMFLLRWGWFPGNTAVVINTSCWVSVNEGTNIYAVCWYMV